VCARPARLGRCLRSRAPVETGESHGRPRSPGCAGCCCSGRGRTVGSRPPDPTDHEGRARSVRPSHRLARGRSTPVPPIVRTDSRGLGHSRLHERPIDPKRTAAALEDHSRAPCSGAVDVELAATDIDQTTRRRVVRLLAKHHGRQNRGQPEHDGRMSHARLDANRTKEVGLPWRHR
jgi:hypothetical protein